MASFFIGKYRTLGCCKPAISVAHTIEKMELACSAYLEKTDPLPIHFAQEIPQLYQRKAHVFFNRYCTPSWPQLPNVRR